MNRPAAPPIFINCRDRLECLKALLDWLERAGCDEIHLVDNDSRYEPLLEFYERSPHNVIHLGKNIGRLSLFVSSDVRELIAGRSFVYTDPDVVPIDECPTDAFLYWAGLLERYPGVHKVGPGLKIDDIPKYYAHRRRVPRSERGFWTDMAEPGVFRAPIDTTFALYRKGTTEFSYDALRTGYPYVARHLGWYVNSSNPPADEHFYHQRVAQNTADSPATSYWSGDNLHPLLLATSSWHADIRKRVALRTRLRRLL